ncbi:MAG: hypothetical protein K6T65_12900 [Peptococcaceae bacterium]|nr:hypothetical protein [Peptococcaceae bacterium]
MIKEIVRDRLQTLARILSGKGKLTLAFGRTSETDSKNITLRYMDTIVPGVPASRAECLLAMKAACAHEAGHIHFTSDGLMREAVRESPVLGELFNIVEDARIERCMANAYPGTLTWFRFLNDYIFIHCSDWGEGPRALLNGLSAYAVVGRVPEKIDNPEILKLIEKCAPIIDRGRLEKDSRGALECAREIWGIIKDYVKSWTPPEAPKMFGSREAKEAPPGSLDPRRKPRISVKPEEREKPEPESGEAGSPESPEERGKDGGPNPEKEPEGDHPEESGADRWSEDLEETPGAEDEPGHSEEDETSDESPDCMDSGTYESTTRKKEPGEPPDDRPEESKEDETAGESPDSMETGEDPEESDSGDDVGETDPGEDACETPEEHEDMREKFREPEEAAADPGGEKEAEETPDDLTDEDSAGHSEYTGGTDKEIDGDVSYMGPGDDSPDEDTIDLGDYDELLETAEDEMKSIESAAFREEKSREPEPASIVPEEIMSEFSKDIHYGCRLVVKEKFSVTEETRFEYEKLLSEVIPHINRTVQEIRKILEYKATLKERGLKKGKLDCGALWKLAAKDPGVFYKVRQPDDIPKLAVYLLVDCSGSMKYRARIEKAKQAACLLAEACVALKIPVNVTGFTAQVRNINEVNHYRVLNFNEADRHKIIFLGALRENRDGYSIRVAAKELELRPEEKKVLMVLSDGLPLSPYMNYHGSIGVADTAKAVRWAEKRGIGVIGLFFGSEGDLPQAQIMYNNLIFVSDIEVLPQTVGRVLKKVIQNL